MKIEHEIALAGTVGDLNIGFPRQYFDAETVNIQIGERLYAMSKLTNLEYEILAAIIAFVRGCVSPDGCRAVVKIEDRKFSSMDSEGNCSGFYTQLSDNSLLSGAVRDIAKQYWAL